MLDKRNLLLMGVGVLCAGLLAGYLFGNYRGQAAGYSKALADTKATQEAVAKNASDAAARAANPFQAANPLEGITANPFADAAKNLNPFAE